MSKAIAKKAFTELQIGDIILHGEIIGFGEERELSRDIIFRAFDGRIARYSESKNAQRIRIYAELQRYTVIEIR